MTRLVVAARYLTIVPIPGAAASTSGLGAAAAWFPVVGLVLGMVLVGVDHLVSRFYAPLLAAMVTVALWKIASGGLHLDGLADCCDGLMGRDPAHRLAIMRDSRVGAFGAIALVLFLLLEAGAVGGIDPQMRGRALLAAPVIGRAMPPIFARMFPAPPSGQGASFRAEVGIAAAIVSLALAAAVALLALGAAGGFALALAMAVVAALGAFMTRRIGGVSGDVHGAGIELSELVVLLSVAALHPAR